MIASSPSKTIFAGQTNPVAYCISLTVGIVIGDEDGVVPQPICVTQTKLMKEVLGQPFR